MIDPFTPGLLNRLPEAPHKVVLLRASRIGDFLCTTPVFRALRAALPHAEITMISLPLLQELVLRSPHLDRFIAFPGFPGIAEQFFDARKTTSFFQHMQEERFDLAIQLQGSGVYSNPFMLLLGARYTAGFVRPHDPPGRLDAALPWPETGHEIERMLAMATFLGIPSQGTATEFPLTAEENLLAHAQPPLLGLHMSARDATRRWSLSRFIEVAQNLSQRHHGTIVILGEEEDYAPGERVAHAIDKPCLNLAGKTSLVVLGAVIAQLSVLITNDTGPAHIAYALKTPTVTIFGSGSPQAYGPLQPGPYRILVHDVPCRPCGYTTCPIGYLCLEGVTVRQVIEAAEMVMR